MCLIEKLLLCSFLVVVMYAIVTLPDIIKNIKKENKEMRDSGCHCPMHFGLFIEISPECPIHGKFCTFSEHSAWNGHKYVLFPYTSIERVPVCKDCLQDTIQENYNLFYTTKVVGMENDTEWPNGCVICEKSTLCAMIPKNFVDDWLEGRVFHFSQKQGGKYASRRAKDISSSVLQKELDRYKRDKKSLEV